MVELVHEREYWNRSQFDSEGRKGHYESYFLRANHPMEPKAFWVRYTIFAPKGRPADNIGEIWVMYFDGTGNCVVAAKEEIPISQCSFSRWGQDVRIGDSTLVPGKFQGKAKSEGNSIHWDLVFNGGQEPLLYLPQFLYDKPFPKAKFLVGTPNALFSGNLVVNGEVIALDQWRGSENHNWGPKHTDEYAWGQVCGFDGEHDAFLECGSGHIKLGPVWSPWMTPAVLRLDGKEYALNSLKNLTQGKMQLKFEGEDTFVLAFTKSTRDIQISCRISAPREHFVGLNYYNPPGGSHTCLNSKIADCELTVKLPDQAERKLVAKHRAAFEILTDSKRHGVPIVA